MPIVTIKLVKPELEETQREELIEDITELLSTKYKKARDRVVVIIEPIEAYNVGFAGKTVEKIKKEGK